MYHVLTARVRDIFIEALRGYWAARPRYADMVDKIQGKYSFKGRPQFGIIVKAGSANALRLSADNFLGTLQGHVMGCDIPGYPNSSVGWATEDSISIRRNGGVFPGTPGIYYGVMQTDRTVTFDPLVDVTAEPVTVMGGVAGQILQAPYPGTLRLYEMPSERLLREGTDYVVGDGDGSSFTLSERLPTGLSLLADYRYPVAQLGPWTVEPERAYGGMIPGVAVYFNRDLAAGDRFAIRVTRFREDVYHEYGGHWELSVDLDVMARDVNAQAEIADATAMFLSTKLRPALADFGLNLMEVGMGGESEEVYDENADDYFYNSSLNVSLQAEWLAWTPLPLRMNSFSATFNQLPNQLQLEDLRDPFYSLLRTGPGLG